MFIPINLQYTEHHLWLRTVGRNHMYVGITDYAQKEVGRIDSLELDGKGSKKKKGESFGKVYGSNKTFELIMPSDGELFIINVEPEANPRILNSDTYHFWIALLSFSNSYGNNKFLSKNEYLQLIEK